MKSIWLTWNNSLRSKTLSDEIGIPLFVHDNDYSLTNRQIRNAIDTISTISKHRPDIIYMQYSYLLLIIVLIYKMTSVKKKYVICDCHTKAIRRVINGTIINYIYVKIKAICFKYINLAIISNRLMIDDVIKYTNNYFILPDKIPNLQLNSEDIFDNSVRGKYCVFVCSYAVDEPLQEVIAAARELHGLLTVYCTGKIPCNYNILKNKPYTNIYFTDYIEHGDYVNLLANAECILALTTEEGCLQCAGYEALSLNVPLVVSDTQALREYFGDSVVYVEDSVMGIVDGIKEIFKKRDQYQYRMQNIRQLREQEFICKLNQLNDFVTSLYCRI